jgi:hypothetical protein
VKAIVRSLCLIEADELDLGVQVMLLRQGDELSELIA